MRTEMMGTLREIFDDYLPVEIAIPVEFRDDLELIQLPFSNLLAHLFIEFIHRRNIIGEGDENKSVPHFAAEFGQAHILAAESLRALHLRGAFTAAVEVERPKV